MRRNKNTNNSSLINQQNRIFESTKEQYIKYNQIVIIERKVRRRQRQYLIKNELTFCILSTIGNNNNSIIHDSQPNTNIIVEVENTTDKI